MQGVRLAGDGRCADEGRCRDGSRPVESARGWIGIAVVLVGGAVALFHFHGTHKASAAARAPTIPVTVASAVSHDVPDLSRCARHRAGLQSRCRSAARSTARCSRSISPKARRSIRATRWRMIDPRPLQAALDQAMAKKAQDEAQLDRRAEGSRRASRNLAQADFATQQSLDQQQAKVDQLKATIEADQGRDRERADAALLRHHHGADRRPRRLPPGRCRQHHPRRPIPIR